MTKKEEAADPELDLDDPEVVAFIREEATRAAALFAGMFPGATLAELRDHTAAFLATHPDLAPLVRAAMKAERPAPASSAKEVSSMDMKAPVRLEARRAARVEQTSGNGAPRVKKRAGK